MNWLLVIIGLETIILSFLTGYFIGFHVTEKTIFRHIINNRKEKPKDLEYGSKK